MAEGAKAGKKPSEFLKSVIGRPVIVKLNSGVEYRGERLPVDAAPRRGHPPLARAVALLAEFCSVVWRQRCCC
jgi:hypothetical protein